MLLLLIYAVGLLLANTGAVVHRYGVAPVNLAFAAVVIFSFFTSLRVSSLLGMPLQGAGLRTAIAVSFVLTYLLLVITFGFGNYAQLLGTEQTRLGENVISQFGILVASILAFYFGTSAYVDVVAMREKRDIDRDERDSPSHSTPSQEKKGDNFHSGMSEPREEKGSSGDHE